MSQRRILTVLGTRPEAIKLFPLYHRLQDDPRIEERLCVSGQHRELIDPVLQLAGLSPHYDLDVMQPGQSLDALAARLLIALGRVLDEEQPDCVVVQGDTATAMSAALAAYHRKIPVAHVEAGLRSGNIGHPWPEEVNRKIISSIAMVHFAPTEVAAGALKRENIDPSTIHVTGNTVIDALHWILGRMDDNDFLFSGLKPIEEKFSSRRIIGVTTHRREHGGVGFHAIAEAIRRLARRPDVAIVFPLHLNPSVRAVFAGALDGLDNVALLEPLDYPHFARLLQIADLMLSDSGGVQEEAPTLGKPVLVLRDATERPEALVAGTARLVGTDADRIVDETNRLLDDPVAYAAMAKAHSPFGDGKASQRITELLAA